MPISWWWGVVKDTRTLPDRRTRIQRMRSGSPTWIWVAIISSRGYALDHRHMNSSFSGGYLKCTLKKWRPHTFLGTFFYAVKPVAGIERSTLLFWMIPLEIACSWRPKFEHIYIRTSISGHSAFACIGMLQLSQGSISSLSTTRGVFCSLFVNQSSVCPIKTFTTDNT